MQPRRHPFKQPTLSTSWERLGGGGNVPPSSSTMKRVAASLHDTCSLNPQLCTLVLGSRWLTAAGTAACDSCNTAHRNRSMSAPMAPTAGAVALVSISSCEAEGDPIAAAKHMRAMPLAPRSSNIWCPVLISPT